MKVVTNKGKWAQANTCKQIEQVAHLWQRPRDACDFKAVGLRFVPISIDR